MTNVIPTPSCGPVGQPATFQARLVHQIGSGTLIAEEGKALQQANIDSITCDVYDLDGATPDVAISSPAVTVSVAVSNTLVDDEIWTDDKIGRNFLHTVSGTVFANPNLYRVVYTATLSVALSSEKLIWVFNHQAQAVTTAAPYRVSQDDVRAIVETDPTISILPFIEEAEVMTDSVEACANDRGLTLSETQLRLISTNLAAHFYSIRDQRYQSKKTADASATFLSDREDYLNKAKMIDTSGCLDSLAKGHKPRFHWLGKPKSAQIDYADRD